MLKNRGFTIIELLVSLAIIAVLFSIVLVLMDNVRERTRDAKRISDMKEISKALALYADNNTIYPIETTAVTITGIDTFSQTLENDDIISEVPTDPLFSPAYIYTYQSNSNGSDYTLTFCLETNTIQNYSQGCGNTITP